MDRADRPLEDSLRLHHHRSETLSAAINAVLDGTEKITKKALDTVEADITAQSPRPPAA